ncbi:MAG TPA: hypothetical protein VL069_08555 [Opitutus sp.]|nr:hypothetical protein [Opitutus sp.]
MNPVFFGTTGAAEDQAGDFHAVSDDADAAVLAGGRERVDRAFETIEHMRDVVPTDFETLVVIVSANFTGRHNRSLVDGGTLDFRSAFQRSDRPSNIRRAVPHAGRFLALPPRILPTHSDDAVQLEFIVYLLRGTFTANYQEQTDGSVARDSRSRQPPPDLRHRKCQREIPFALHVSL